LFTFLEICFIVTLKKDKKGFGIMGCGPSNMTDEEKEELRMAKALEVKSVKNAQVEKKVMKLLLLGAGEAGKSTIFKQLSMNYGGEMTKDEKMEYVQVIHRNVIESMTVLLKATTKNAKDGGVDIEDDNKEFADTLWENRRSFVLTAALADCVDALWKDKGVMATWEHVNELQIPESSSYFFNKVKDLVAEDYIPSTDDILRSRKRTLGIQENQFTVKGNSFKVVDVGGQRNERRKWIQAFDEVQAVLFVAGISEYNQKVWEDEKTNRLVEAWDLFAEQCNSDYFKETDFVVFLNKSDLFKDKLEHVALKDYFEEYIGDNSFDDAAKWIEGKFADKNMVPRDKRRIFFHKTCATDQDNIKKVFDSVRASLVEKGIGELGL